MDGSIRCFTLIDNSDGRRERIELATRGTMSDELLEQMKRLAAEKPPWGATSDYFTDYPAPEMPASRRDAIRAAMERMLMSFADYLTAQQTGAFERTPDSDQRIVDANRAWNRDLAALYALIGIPDDE